MQETSCVNRDIEVFNRKLHKTVKTADNVKIIQANLRRNDFTLHGLHLNFSGKEKMAELMGGGLMARKEETTIILKWEENQKDPTRKEVKEKLINDDNKVLNLKEVRSSETKIKSSYQERGFFLWITE
jgi:hypothetical protein